MRRLGSVAAGPGLWLHLLGGMMRLGLRDLAECPRCEVWTVSLTPPCCGECAVPEASNSQEIDFRKVVFLFIFKPKVLLLI